MVKPNQPEVTSQDEAQIVATCPISNQETVGKLWERQQFFGDYETKRQVIWWYCSGCQNWHTLFVDMNPAVTDQPE